MEYKNIVEFYQNKIQTNKNMNSNRYTTIKLQFNNELRKFCIPTPISFSRFKSIIGSVFNIEDDIHNFEFSYLDESMEEIKLHSDVELGLALSSSPLRYIIKRNENGIELISKLMSTQHITEKEEKEEDKEKEYNLSNNQIRIDTLKKNIKLTTQRMKMIIEEMKVIKNRLREKCNQMRILSAVNFDEISDEINNDRKTLIQCASDLKQLKLECRSFIEKMKSIRGNSHFTHNPYNHPHLLSRHYSHPHSQMNLKSNEELIKLKDKMKELKEKKKEVLIEIESLRSMIIPHHSNQHQLHLLSQLKNQLFELKEQLLSLRSQYKLTRHLSLLHNHPHHHRQFHHRQNDRKVSCDVMKFQGKCGGRKENIKSGEDKDQKKQICKHIMEIKSNKLILTNSELQSLKSHFHPSVNLPLNSHLLHFPVSNPPPAFHFNLRYPILHHRVFQTPNPFDPLPVSQQISDGSNHQFAL